MLDLGRRQTYTLMAEILAMENIVILVGHFRVTTVNVGTLVT